MDKGYSIDWDTVWEQYDHWIGWYYATHGDRPSAVYAGEKMQELVEAQLQQQRAA